MCTDKLDNYKTCSSMVRKQINDIVSGLSSLLKTSLIGVYLHGSMVLDAFAENSSDIDIMAVIDRCLSVAEKIEMGSFLLSRNKKPCPLDLEVLIKEAFEPWGSPPVGHFYFSDYWARKYERISLGGENAERLLSAVFSNGELIADMKLVKQSGICLYGIPINEMFPEIPDELYLASVSSKVADFYVESDNNSQSSYLVLTLCRILSFKKIGKILSKPRAAKWALDELPSMFHPIILSSLYKKYGVGHEISYTLDDALSFKSYMIESIV